MNKAACCRSVSSSSIDMPSERDGELIILSAGNIQRESDDVNEVDGEGEGAVGAVVIGAVVVAELVVVIGTVVLDALFVSDTVVVVEEEAMAETECCDSLDEDLLNSSSAGSLMESLVLSLMSIVDAVLLWLSLTAALCCICSCG